MFTVTNKHNDTPIRKQLNVLAIGEREVGIRQWLSCAVTGRFPEPGAFGGYCLRVSSFYKNINSTDRIVLWMDSRGHELAFYDSFPSSFRDDAGFRRAQPSAIVIILDLTLDQELLKTQVFNHKQRYEMYMKPGTLVYFVGTKTDLLDTQKIAWDKLTYALQDLQIRKDYNQCFVTSAKTGYGMQHCIDWIIHETIAAKSKYTIDDFINDYNRQYKNDVAQRRFPEWMYPSSAMQRLIANYPQQSFDFNTVISRGGERAQATLKVARVDRVDSTGNFMRIVINSPFSASWRTFLCCLFIIPLQKTSCSNKGADSTLAKRIYEDSNIVKAIFQFAAPDMDTLVRTSLFTAFTNASQLK